MFVKGELSRERALKRRKKYLKGKNTKQKFKHLMPEVIEKLKALRPFMKALPESTRHKFEELIREHEQIVHTTSNEKALDSLIECGDDIDDLLDEMRHGTHRQSHEQRLSEILGFLRDFHNRTYIKYEKPYKDDPSALGKSIESVARTFHMKAAQIESEMAEKEDEMLHYEKENTALAETLEDISKQSAQYSTTAAKIKKHHSTITALKSHLNTLRKNHTIMSHFARMFEQLAINETYHGNLKAEGPIRKLINRIQKNPAALDVMSDTSELSDALNRMKEELSEIESIIEPSRKMAFDDEDAVDEDLISQYQSMNNS